MTLIRAQCDEIKRLRRAAHNAYLQWAGAPHNDNRIGQKRDAVTTSANDFDAYVDSLCEAPQTKGAA